MKKNALKKLSEKMNENGLSKELLDALICIKCSSSLDYFKDKLVCRKCRKEFKVENGIPNMIDD